MAFLIDSEEEFDAEAQKAAETEEMDGAMDKALVSLARDLNADEAEWDAYAGNLILTYGGKGWYEGYAGGDSPDEPSGFSGAWAEDAEDAEDDIEADLAKISDRMESLGYGITWKHADVKKAFADSETEVKSDPENLIRRKTGRYGDWEYEADCRIYMPLTLTKGKGTSLATEAETGTDKAELLDKLINAAAPGSGLRIELEKIRDRFGLEKKSAPKDLPLDDFDTQRQSDELPGRDEYEERLSDGFVNETLEKLRMIS